MTERDLAPLEKALGHPFDDRSLLERALVHASARGELDIRDNETYEFLGDAVLDLAVGHLLMLHFPDVDEGVLSKRRAALVCEETLAELAGRFELGHWLVLGKGEEASDGRSKPSILAGAFEAVIGALYLDAGYDACNRIVTSHFEGYMGSFGADTDDKTALQELTQKRYKTTPDYEVIETTGPDHAREYEVAVVIEGRELARGRGTSRKRAEQDAARLAAARIAEESG